MDLNRLANVLGLALILMAHHPLKASRIKSLAIHSQNGKTLADLYREAEKKASPGHQAVYAKWNVTINRSKAFSYLYLQHGNSLSVYDFEQHLEEIERLRINTIGSFVFEKSIQITTMPISQIYSRIEELAAKATGARKTKYVAAATILAKIPPSNKHYRNFFSLYEKTLKGLPEGAHGTFLSLLSTLPWGVALMEETFCAILPLVESDRRHGVLKYFWLTKEENWEAATASLKQEIEAAKISKDPKALDDLLPVSPKRITSLREEVL